MYFERLLDETHEEFIEKNALLFECCSASLDQDGRRFDKIYDLGVLSKQASDDNDILVYFEYIAAVVNLYAILCADRNLEGINIMRNRIGVSNYFLLAVTDLGTHGTFEIH